MKLWNDLKFLVEGISEANKQLVKDVKEVATETKRDILTDWKEDAPLLGKTAEKVDQAITSLKNVKERLPDPTTGPINPQPQLKKMLKDNTCNKELISKKSIKRARHLKVNRTSYSHHALSINEYQVIHYRNGEVRIDTIEDFAKGATIYIVNTPRLYKKDEVIQRAYSKLGEQEYNLFFNNCEHFVKWALNG